MSKMNGLNNLMKTYKKMAKPMKKSKSKWLIFWTMRFVCSPNFEHFHVHVLYDCHNICIASHPKFQKLIWL